MATRTPARCDRDDPRPPALHVAFTLAAALLLGQLLPGGACLAGAPVDSTSTVPRIIHLVGTSGGIADPWGQFQVVVRDADTLAVPFVPVTVDFSSCLDTHPAAVQPFPGMQGDCSQLTVQSDADGVAVFDIVGEVHRFWPRSAPRCARIYAGGVLLGTATVASFDLDGVDGVDWPDVKPWLCDFVRAAFFHEYAPRSDFNLDSSINAPDLSIWLYVWLGEHSAESAVRCDGQPNSAPRVLAEDGALELAWNDCLGGGGVETRTFACNSNSQTIRVHGSLVAPSSPPLDSLLGFAAVLQLAAPPGTSLPDWWRFEDLACRAGAMTWSTVVQSCPAAITNPATTKVLVDYPYAESNLARLRIWGMATEKVVLEPGVEYNLFTLSLPTTKTVGVGACAGCTTRVAVTWESLELIEGSGCSDPNPCSPGLRVLLTAPQRILWQGPIADVVGPAASAGPRLWLAGGNPGRGALRVGFALPTAHPARIEVVDLAGRRVLGRWLEAPAPGRGEATLGRAGELSPGLYFVRLTQAGRQATVKTVLTR